jgi:hypothetical protein
VPNGETEIASTAGAGSLLMEFYTLSQLTGNATYRDFAFNAMQGIYNRRSPVGLVGKHIHVGNGRWSETISGIGSNSDSYYEYMLKCYLMTLDEELFTMFSVNFVAIKRHLQEGDWFGDVDMFTGKMRRNRVENLHAFWPGVEASIGFTRNSAKLLNAFMAVWQSLGFMPEEMDQSQWLSGKHVGQSFYPLRPEIIESMFYQYRATQDKSWIVAARLFMQSIENKLKTKCGYASVTNFERLELMDMQPSFFLSETCKYLYLMFDESSFIHVRPYIFTTEAHPFDLRQLSAYKHNGSSSFPASQRTQILGSELAIPTSVKSIGNLLDMLLGSLNKTFTMISEDAVEKSMPRSCARSYWWEKPVSFDPDYIDIMKNKDKNNDEDETEASIESTQKRVIDDVLRMFISTSKHSFSDKMFTKHGFDINTFHSFADDQFHKAHMTGKNMTTEIDTVLDQLLHITKSCPIDHANTSEALETNQRNTIFQQPSLSQTMGHDIENPAQSVDLALNNHGTFTVNIYTDGFQIHSKQYGNWLEMLNLGQLDIFVREFNDSFSQVVIGNTLGEVRRCQVSVADEDGQFLWSR